MTNEVSKKYNRFKTASSELWNSFANRVIRILILANTSVTSAWGFTNPLLAVFITKQIHNGNLQTVGFASALYWIVKSVLQVFIARYLDKADGETDDFYSAVLGSVIDVIVPLGYIFARDVSQIYLLSVIMGLGDAMFVPAWYSIYTRHIDHDRIGFEWTLNSVGIGLGVSITAAMGGIIANRYGFAGVFFLTALFQALGAAILILLVKDFVKLKKIPAEKKVAPCEVGVKPLLK